MEPPWEGRTKVSINGQGHMTKMAAMPIYGKTFKNLLLQNQKSYDLESWHVSLGGGVKLYKVYINDDPELTLTHFKTMSNLAKHVFILTVAPDIR